MFVSYAQNFEDVMLWRALRSVDNGFYIDVGAHSATTDSVTAAFYERNWSGINIEPVTEWFDELAVVRPRDINLKLCVGSAPGLGVLFVIPATGLSTLSASIAASHQSEGWTVRKEAVEIMPLAEICRRHVAGPIHFLKIDVEGFEREVLAGADFVNFRPWIVLVEANAPSSQLSTHDNWEGALLRAGYEFVWFDGLNRFYVADEYAASLRESFRCPPNVFDGFKLNPRHNFVLPSEPGLAPPELPEPDAFPVDQPIAIGVEQRIAMTLRCRDADAMPRVPDAGTVYAGHDGTSVQVLHNGLRVVADGYCGAWMTKLIAMAGGHHEPQEEILFHHVLTCMADDAVMIDLGAYRTYYSLWFLLGAPDRRALALEPDPAHLDIGRRNAALNGLSPVFVHGAAGRETAAPRPFSTESSGILQLPTIAVPDLMEMLSVDKIDILHCDAQGAELAVLEGCQDLIRAGRIGWIFLSTHAHQISGDPLIHQRCLALLLRLGAKVEVEHDVHESFTGDGLIVARFGPPPAGWRGPFEISYNRYSTSLFRNPLYDLAEARRR